MEENNVRVFTDIIRSHDRLEEAQQRLVKRAEVLGLTLNDGVFAVNYHPTSKLFVVILTITPTAATEPK